MHNKYIFNILLLKLCYHYEVILWSEYNYLSIILILQ